MQCLCAGIVVADVVSSPIAAFPPPGTLVLTPGIELTIGGCAANVAADLAKLGVDVGIAGCVGRDRFGVAVREMLAASGVQTQSLVESAEHPTASTVIVNITGEDRRFIHCAGSNQAFDGSQLANEDLASCRILYLGGYGLLPALTGERLIELFRTARSLNVITVLDVVLPANCDAAALVKPVLPWTDYFFPNTDEAQIILGETHAGRQARRFVEWGAGHAIVTCGSDGAWIARGEELWRSRSYPARPVDSTGTGDAFVAGFLYSLLQQRTLPDAVRAGAALGASCVQAMGATTGILTAGELAEFLRCHPLDVDRAEG